MAETRKITLGGRTFDVPPFVLRLNLKLYPLCRKLTNGEILERSVRAGGVLEASEEEMADLADLAFQACRAGDPELTREAFDELAITPPELLDAFFTARYQTGAWLPVPAGDAGEGEGQGEARPLNSTSAESSPA